MRTPRSLPWLLLLLIALLCVSCGGGSGGTTTPVVPAVTIFPLNPTVSPGGNVSFQASVTGEPDELVTWSANVGTIGAGGYYTAPTVGGSYRVTATSVANPAISASTTVYVTSNTGITVSVTPPTATLGYGAQAQFAATVTGSSNQNVTWTASSGTITANGLFTAPNRSTQVTVQAHSAANPIASASAQVTVTNTGAIVQINPLSAQVPELGTYQFQASVLHVSNQNVTWSATGGTIDGTGLFTAAKNIGYFSVTATSVADPTQSATVPIAINPVFVTISEASSQVVVNQPMVFSAKITGISNQTVTWSASAGTITQQGVFTAPSTAQSVTITATSTQNSGYTASTTETVVTPTDDFFNFDNGVPGSWSPTTWSTTPSNVPFLGLLGGNSQKATLSLSSLTAHSNLTINFQLFVVGAWTGLNSNAPFVVTVDGAQAFSQSFSNVLGQNQSYPDGLSDAPGTGAVATNSLGYVISPAILYNDATYSISLTNVPHTANTVTILFSTSLSGTLTQMSWGLKNVEVIANP